MNLREDGREDFMIDYDSRWSNDDEREWDDHDRDGDSPDEEIDE